MTNDERINIVGGLGAFGIVFSLIGAGLLGIYEIITYLWALSHDWALIVGVGLMSIFILACALGWEKYLEAYRRRKDREP